MNYHVLLAQDDISEAGPQLAQAIVDAQQDLALRAGSQPLRALATRASGCSAC